MPNVMLNTPSDHPTKPAPRRDWSRWKELLAMRAAQREQIVAGLLAGLGREPGEADRVAANTIAAMQGEAERLETLGKSALEQRRIVAQLLRQSGFKPAPTTPAKQSKNIRRPCPAWLQDTVHSAGAAAPRSAP
ncbi:hypothetical protein ACRQ5Q_41950 (plasmid) [Bradyrhizobium sp. PMVTL-01]|uniref:hypothetical protein n=1 Tax=Bradyrhizobium sp. PMVTL-01 TaxID=3434999 RepID=UPI003F6F5B40